MTTLLRWGRSAYETDAALAEERRLLAALGVPVLHFQGADPPLDGVTVMAVTSKVQVTEALLSRAPDLKLVVTTTSGHEHIDVQAAQARGVAVARCPLARRDAVVDTAVGMALSFLRDLPGLQARARAGVWARGELPARAPRRARDVTVGVVGLGVIGRRAAEVWAALGAQVLACDPAVPGTLPLAELLPRADVLTLHCALTASSSALIHRGNLHRLKPGVILINTARGGCLDLPALLHAPRIGGLGLDVFPQEPWPELAALAARDDVLITPHAAGYHPGLGEAVAAELADTVACFLAGRPLPHPVTAA
ncbi:MAG: hydroxyacid dehydrogenase [Alphaproteobacteria bacterium]|nr:hydroxyacid dehydrogenase [Alphaproteobacteria bacterium]